MKNRKLFCKDRTSQVLLSVLALALLLPVATAQGQDNSFSFDSVCGTEQGNYEFGTYVRLYSPPIENNQDIIIAQTENTIRVSDAADEAIGIVSGAVSLKSTVGSDDALEILSTSHPIMNDGLNEIGVNPFGPVSQHVTEYVVGAGSSLVTGGIKGGAQFAAEEAIYLIKDSFTLFSLLGLNKDLRTLNAVQSVAFPYFKSCRDRSYVASRFGYPSDYPTSEAEFFGWMLDRIEEGQGSIDEEEAEYLLLQLSEGVRQTATSIRNRLGFRSQFENRSQIGPQNDSGSETQGDLAITGVTPPVLVGSTNSQKITIRGVGFSPSASLRFDDGIRTYDREPEFVNASTLRYDINVGTEEANWTVQVRDKGSSSNTETFKVQSATFEDETAPDPPEDLTVTSKTLADEKTFDVFWVNPSDPSGITKFWYKLGEAPTHAEDGTSLDVQRHNPFSVTVTDAGETPVYVWLEDGAGNKSHYNRASVVIKRDDLPPAVTIQEPTDDWSRSDDGYPVDESTLTLEGTMSDSQSDILSVFWINQATGESGFGDLSGSSWTMEDIPLVDGANAIGALALDAAGNIGFDILGVQYDAPGDNYSLSVSAANGTVEVDPDRRSFSDGEEVELTADPDDGYEFDEWGGDASGDENPLTLTMDEDKSITASFVEDGGGGGSDEGPDLVIEDEEVDPSEVAIGKKFEVSYVVVNEGNEDVNSYTDGDSWQIEHYLSEDASLSGDDERLGEAKFCADNCDGPVLIPRRSPGWDEDIDEDYAVPNNLSPGNYHVLIVADREDEVNESDEDNNVEDTELTVLSERDGPDLVIEDLDVAPSKVTPGQEIEFSYTVANRGDAHVKDYADERWEVAYYLSEDTALDEEDERLENEDFVGPEGELPGGVKIRSRQEPGWTDEIETVEVAPNVPSGEYFLLFVADDEKNVTESDEGNNVEVASVSIENNKAAAQLREKSV